MQELMYHVFGSERGEEHWWFRGRIRIIESLLEEVLKNQQGLKILDVGCGTGVMLSVLSKYGSVDGLDSSEIALNYCRKRGLKNVSLIQGSFPESIPPGTKYNLITMFDVLEHVDDDVSTLRSAFELLPPGGMILVTVPAYNFLWGPNDRLNLHRRRYKKKELGEKARVNGFSIVRLSYFNTILFIPVLFVKFIKRLSNTDVPDMQVFPSHILNRVLTSVFSAEKSIIKHADLPFGVSLLLIGLRER